MSNTNQKIISISLDPDKHAELKKKAIDAGIPLSQMFDIAGSVVTLSQIKEVVDTRGAQVQNSK